ncbi:NAD-dependent epimerase/dehydratase family protein [Celeribacter sp.]|uniref:NAD-dependent epimerase/dehydratase family protein n=1 Tax=Celeribacter sp. TaxID=1890673 RepID=UPI003A93C479
MKTVITGGAGFIGSRLAGVLLERGHEVVILDNLSPQIHGEIPQVSLPDGTRYLRADIRDIEAQAEEICAADAIFHLAAETGTGQSMYQIEKYVEVNELGTGKLLQVLSGGARKPRKLILASSRSVYGEGAYRDEETGALVQPSPRDPHQLASGEWDPRSKRDGATVRAVATPESFPFSADSVYAATKAAQELLMIAAAPGLGAVTNVFRFQNVFGEGQSLQNPYTGIISIFFNRARQGLDIPLYEDGLPARDFIHVDDVVRPLADALEADLENGSTINLGSGVPTTIRELAEKLCTAAGFSVPIEVTGQYRVGDIRQCWADLTVAKDLLGFAPTVSLEQGLERFSTWARQQPEHSDNSAQALRELKEKGLSN